MSENPSREFALQVVKTLTHAGHQALWAGGCVRDSLLGKTPKDYDVATSARPDQVRQVFGRKRTLAVGESFGVIVVLGPKAAGPIEVATFRTEGNYTDGRHPGEVQFSTAEEDAQRRDFTINGMFYDPLAEQVLDFVGGEADLRAKILRAIGNPAERMTEDKLRMMRAVRFAANLGFELDEATAQAIRHMANEITVVSAERITQEWRRMLAHVNRRRAVKLCKELGLLSVILSEVDPCETRLAVLEALGETDFETAFAAMLLTQPETTLKTICERFRLSNQETEKTVWLVHHRESLRGAAGFSLAHLKRLLIQPHIPALLSLLRTVADVAGAPTDDITFCEQFLDSTPAEVLNPRVLLTGNDLIDQGFKPGPDFKRLLDAVRDAQLNLEISTHEEALALLNRLRDNGPDGT